MHYAQFVPGVRLSFSTKCLIMPHATLYCTYIHDINDKNEYL